MHDQTASLMMFLFLEHVQRLPLLFDQNGAQEHLQPGFEVLATHSEQAPNSEQAPTRHELSGKDFQAFRSSMMTGPPWDLPMSLWRLCHKVLRLAAVITPGSVLMFLRGYRMRIAVVVFGAFLHVMPPIVSFMKGIWMDPRVTPPLVYSPFS